MADIQIREDRMKANEEILRAKRERQRQQVTNGFSSSGRPQSAAGRGRRAAPVPPVKMPAVNGGAMVDSGRFGGDTGAPRGMVNDAFDDPEVIEVISNHEAKNTSKPSMQILKVEVHANDELEEIETPNTSRSVDSNKTLTDEIEELSISEPKQALKIKKGKKKRAKTPPEKTTPNAPSPTDTTTSIGQVTPPPYDNALRMPALVREDTILFPGDEYYRQDQDQQSRDLDDQSINEGFQPIQPEQLQPTLMQPDRPLSRISIQTTAGSAGIEDLEAFVFQPAPQDEQIQCRITRDRHGLDNRAYPVYYLHLERENMKKVFLLGARKRKKTTTSSYVIN